MNVIQLLLVIPTEINCHVAHGPGTVVSRGTNGSASEVLVILYYYSWDWRRTRKLFSYVELLEQIRLSSLGPTHTPSMHMPNLFIIPIQLRAGSLYYSDSVCRYYKKLAKSIELS